jgi:hypothetical protein
MATKSKYIFFLLVLTLGLLALVPAALAVVTWNPTASGDLDNANQEFDWAGTIIRDSSSQHYVCVVFENAVIAPIVCSAQLTDAETAYACSLPFQTLNNVGSAVNWEVVHAPNANCAGFGTQDPPGDEGTIQPTAVSLTSFSANGQGVWLPVLALLLLALTAIFAAYLALRKTVSSVQ